MHVLGTPPALVLSQDQTLHENHKPNDCSSSLLLSEGLIKPIESCFPSREGKTRSAQTLFGVPSILFSMITRYTGPRWGFSRYPAVHRGRVRKILPPSPFEVNTFFHLFRKYFWYFWKHRPHAGPRHAANLRPPPTMGFPQWRDRKKMLCVTNAAETSPTRGRRPIRRASPSRHAFKAGSTEGQGSIDDQRVGTDKAAPFQRGAHDASRPAADCLSKRHSPAPSFPMGFPQ